jgi:coenzyme F420-dependent glucose-6-phosphate dehydrogenase
MNKVQIGYHASHEQFRPSDLLRWVRMAEDVGFHAINSSDHFNPWSERQGESGFSFAWLGAAMQSTNVPYNVVCAPGQRYHPAIVAQAIATLCQMFEGRFSVSLGSGEAINESITGDDWPEKAVRNKRLHECYQIIKALLDGKTVTHDGTVKIEQARLYTLPEMPPLLAGAAVTKETAKWMGQWANALITTHKNYEELKEIVDAFRENGGKDKPLYLKVQLSYARKEEDAAKGAYDQWRNNVLPADLLTDLPTVKDFDAKAKDVNEQEVRAMVNVSSDIEEHAKLIEQYASLGFERIFLHNVNRDQETFIKDFGERLLPLFQ